MPEEGQRIQGMELTWVRNLLLWMANYVTFDIYLFWWHILNTCFGSAFQVAAMVEKTWRRKWRPLRERINHTIKIWSRSVGLSSIIEPSYQDCLASLGTKETIWGSIHRKQTIAETLYLLVFVSCSVSKWQKDQEHIYRFWLLVVEVSYGEAFIGLYRIWSQ